MKKIIKKLAAILAILILMLAPILLMIDYQRFTPVVAFIWVLAVTYFVFIRLKK